MTKIQSCVIKLLKNSIKYAGTKILSLSPLDKFDPKASSHVQRGCQRQFKLIIPCRCPNVCSGGWELSSSHIRLQQVRSHFKPVTEPEWQLPALAVSTPHRTPLVGIAILELPAERAGSARFAPWTVRSSSLILLPPFPFLNKRLVVLTPSQHLLPRKPNLQQDTDECVSIPACHPGPPRNLSFITCVPLFLLKFLCLTQCILCLFFSFFCQYQKWNPNFHTELYIPPALLFILKKI